MSFVPFGPFLAFAALAYLMVTSLLPLFESIYIDSAQLSDIERACTGSGTNRNRSFLVQVTFP